jgi:hypothetical protein
MGQRNKSAMKAQERGALFSRRRATILPVKHRHDVGRPARGKGAGESPRLSKPERRGGGRLMAQSPGCIPPRGNVTAQDALRLRA